MGPGSCTCLHYGSALGRDESSLCCCRLSSACPCVCLPVCLTVYLSVCLSDCVFCVPVCLSDCVFVCLSADAFACLRLGPYLYFSLSACLPVCSFVCLWVCQTSDPVSPTSTLTRTYRDTAYRVVADHVRTLTFAITDGALPSNEGRGYVLRRILRRAVRYAMQTLGAKPGFFSQLVPIVAKELGGAFPELVEKNAMVQEVVAEEERAFSSLLERGVKYFGEMQAEIKSQGGDIIPGDRAFFLYDTLGFPIDLTEIMANEIGLKVDVKAFQAAMTEQKDRSRVATRAKRLAGRTALTFGAEQTSYLAKDMGVKVTVGLCLSLSLYVSLSVSYSPLLSLCLSSSLILSLTPPYSLPPVHRSLTILLSTYGTAP